MNLITIGDNIHLVGAVRKRKNPAFAIVKNYYKKRKYVKCDKGLRINILYHFFGTTLIEFKDKQSIDKVIEILQDLKENGEFKGG